ncbi:hypothetical protein ACFO5R_03560 [Halosolutus amylolyticus]|uniref:Uncharacterized protein n=1 Tax=Halosolutus amylolyticus TaxID=2932267 RepID=A0ABD5PK71_9EURY|nr:hypothetical protein [Halosolutus amylolyticus]
MGDGSWTSWVSSRKATNQLLGFMIVVLAAGFVSVGDIGPGSIQVVSEAVLVLILVVAIVLFLGWLMLYDR